MDWFLVCLLTYFAAAVQAGLAGGWSIGAIAPDLLLLVAVSAALLGRRPLAWLLAIPPGLAADLDSLGRLGPALVSFTLAAACVQWSGQRIKSHTAAARFGLVLAGGLIGALGDLHLRWLLGDVDATYPVMLARALGVVLYTASLSVPLWMAAGSQPATAH